MDRPARFCLAALFCLGGCITDRTVTTNACPSPTTRFEISRSSGAGTCQPNPSGAAPGASCNAASDCQPACCNGSDVQLCIDNICQSTASACACAELSPQSTGASTCGGEQWSSGLQPRGGATAGASCRESSECAEVSCPCPNGAIGYYAAACTNGTCDATNACACVAQQYTTSSGNAACAAPPAAPPPPPSSCGGESAAAGSSPRTGTPAGGACTSSSSCSETICPCANGAPSYYAAACVSGKCDATTACSCVATQLEASTHQDVCAAPPPPPPSSCDGASSSQSGARSGASAGGSCTDSSQCAQAVCTCSSGTTFYAAECVSGVCNNTGACSCVEQKYAATFGMPLCN